MRSAGATHHHLLDSYIVDDRRHARRAERRCRRRQELVGDVWGLVRELDIERGLDILGEGHLTLEVGRERDAVDLGQQAVAVHAQDVHIVLRRRVRERSRDRQRGADIVGASRGRDRALLGLEASRRKCRAMQDLVGGSSGQRHGTVEVDLARGCRVRRDAARYSTVDDIVRDLYDIQRLKADEVHAAREPSTPAHQVLHVQKKLSLACSLCTTNHAVERDLPPAQEP